MNDPKYGYAYPPPNAYPSPNQGYYQGPPVMAPPQYAAAPPPPPPRRQAGFLKGCLAVLRCLCCMNHCCSDPSISGPDPFISGPDPSSCCVC